MLRAFEMLYLCRTKQEFLNLMREKGISAQSEKNVNLGATQRGRGKKRMTKKISGFDKLQTKLAPKALESTENRKNHDESEEIDENSNYDPDKNILNRFMKEQKKEIDNFINQKEIQAEAKKKAAAAAQAQK